jgi:superfamily II DNA or RNA helicase
MIKFTLYDNNYIQITAKREICKSVEEFLTDFTKNFMFSPKYKAGVWNGKISLFKRSIRGFPYGLFIDVLKHVKKTFLSEEITISSDVKKIFKGIDIKNLQYNLLHKPYNYQQDCIETMLKFSKGICIVATAGGKSLIIAYLIDNINLFYKNKSLIIVPTLQLVNQFKGDLIEYGIKSSIGIVNAKNKEFNKNIVISTWQSLQNQIEELYQFNTIICDEVHTVQAVKLQEILENCYNAKFKFGVTGTLPTNRLDKMNVKSFIGTVLKTYRGSDLAKLGFISKCIIKMLYIHYKENFKGDYNDVKDEIFQNEYRIGLIKYIVSKKNNSILILIDKVEKEGFVLEERLKKSFPKKEIVFLSGKDSSEIRDDYRKRMNDVDNMVIIATYQTFQMGTNIKSLRTIILASSTKSFIRVIQSLGRVLRKHVTKELGGAELYDIVDNCKFLSNHADKRYKHYTKEGHEIIEMDFYESSNIYEDLL